MNTFIKNIGCLMLLTACTSTINKLPFEHSLGILKVNIDLKTGSASAAAIYKPSLPESRSVALDPGISIVLNRKKVGYVDDETNNIRYVSATFEVINNTTTIFNNFTIWALDVPTASGVGVTASLFGTMFTTILNGTGSAITDGNIIRNIQPIHSIKNTLTGFDVDPLFANLQFISSSEASEVQAQLSTAYGITTGKVLQYGFVANNYSGGRTIAARNTATGCTIDACKGLVTLAFKIPVPPLSTALRNTRPWGFAFQFALGNQTKTYSSQSVEEQTANTLAGLGQVVGTPRMLYGSSRGFFDQDVSPGIENLCQIVTANPSGTAFSAPNLLPVKPVDLPGSLDTCFGSGGVTRLGLDEDTIAAAVMYSDKLVVVGGSAGQFIVGRLNQDGRFDSSFNGGAVKYISIPGATSAVASAVTIGENSSILIAGTANNGVNTDIAAVALNPDGSLSPVFDGDGIKLIDFGGNEIGTQVKARFGSGVPTTYFFAGTKLGSTKDFVVAKTSYGGTLDTTWGTAGKVTIDDGADELLADFGFFSDGSVLLAGTKTSAGINDILIAKLGTTGALATTFGTNGKRIMSFPASNTEEVRAMTISDKIILTGSTASPASNSSAIMVARLLLDGSLDTSFSGDGFASSAVAGSSAVGTSIAISLGNFVTDRIIMIGGYSKDTTGATAPDRDFVCQTFSLLDGSLGVPCSTNPSGLDISGQESDDAVVATIYNNDRFNPRLLLIGSSLSGGDLDTALAQFIPF
jgi:uncharacterized delta-60 repeat protein